MMIFEDESRKGGKGGKYDGDDVDHCELFG